MGLSGKLKRKDIDQVNDDFSDFSLSSPATKIRRLDAELPPIIEEDESFPPPPENHERAIVLFNPSHLLHTPLMPAPSTLSFSLNSDLISGFKNQFLRATDTNSADVDEFQTEEESKKAREGCLAVIPWVPSQVPSTESRYGELEFAPDSMDVEENNCNNNNVTMEQEHEYGVGVGGGGGLKPSEALHHCSPPPPPPPPPPQQHCMIQQPPQTPFTPITWSQ